MSGVEFQENNFNTYTSRKILGDPQVPTTVSLLLKTHIFKTEAQAFKGMIALTILLFLTSIFFLYTTYRNQAYNGPIIPYEDMSALQQQKIPLKERVYLERQKLIQQ